MQGIIVRASYSMDLELEGYTAPRNCEEKLREKGRGSSSYLEGLLRTYVSFKAFADCGEYRM